MTTPPANGEPTLNKERHVTYMLRCLKTLLPRAYMSSDSNRMTLAYFIIAGLDLLGALETSTTETERAGYVNWIYSCQVPTGKGFRGFPGTDFGDEKRTPENECWDPGNLPATFFALVTLLVLQDDLSRVERKECLRWLWQMQRDDGSFGEVLGSKDVIEGGRDLRFCCCAAGIRYMLRGNDLDNVKDIEDINVPKLISYVKSCQSYDGGFAEAPGHESHAGLTYCALGTLSFLGVMSDDTMHSGPPSRGPATRYDDLVRWLTFRQTTLLYEEDGEVETQNEQGDTQIADAVEPPQRLRPGAKTRPQADDVIPSLPVLPEASQFPREALDCAGFNGRINKIADTCYCFWVTGSLAFLNHIRLVNANANRKFLLGKTQHIIGGFGKCVDEPPDVLHSYLGLASLALLGESNLEEVDPTFCASKRTRRHLESLPWWSGKAS